LPYNSSGDMIGSVPEDKKSRRASIGERISAFIRRANTVVVAVITACCALVQGAEIHDAAGFGDLEKVKAYLLQDPKQINTADANGRTVLDCAILSGKKALVEFLLEKGATENIFAAAATGHADKVSEFLKQDPKLISAKDSSGKTPLHWAAFYGQKNVVELLLAQKADVNALDGYGFTPLHWAAEYDRSDVVEVLLNNKADFNIKVANYGWTPLRLAVIHDHIATADVLMKRGSDPNVKDDENIPLLHQAVLSGKKDMVELLLARKANVNTKDADGETALGEAFEKGDQEIIGILVKHGGQVK